MERPFAEQTEHSVSYTHLDVYKRQELSGVEIKNLREIPPLVRKLTAAKELAPAAA